VIRINFLERFEVRLSRKYRLAILLLIVISTTIGYMARMGVSVALPFISEDFNWSVAQQGNLGGLLLGIFLVSYGVSNFLLSPYVDRFGTKKSLSVAAFAWSLSLLVASFFGHIYYVFLLSRILLGFSQGILFPAASKIVVGWFPLRERSRANSAYLAGGPLGSLLSPLLLAPLIVQTSWKASFYIVAATGFLLIIPVLIFLRDVPKNNENSNETRPQQTNASSNFGEYVKVLLVDRQFQLIVFAFWAMNCVWWGTSLWLPTYLVEAQNISFAEMSYSATIPYLGALAGLFLASWISDITGSRKKLVVFALFLQPLLFLILFLITSPTRVIVLIILVAVFFSANMSVPVIFTMMQGTTEEGSVGAATGVMNGIGNGVGIVGPLLIGFIVSLTGSYNLGLLSLGLISLIGAVTFQVYYHPGRSE